MKRFSMKSRSLRYGGVTAALTALIIAVVIIFNVIFSLLAQRFLWYIDMTPDLLYTLSDECLDLIRDGDKELETVSPIEMVNKIREENKAHNEAEGLSEGDEGYLDEDLYINIVFCDDIDTLQSNASQRYVYNSALELQNEFPDHIKVINYNIIRNPSAVSRFKTNSSSTIATTNVIVEFGTEFRVYSLKSFFTFDEGEESDPWAYNGEKKLASGILAVTRAESPIACITTNHGETFTDTALYDTLVDAGYLVEDINLLEDEIPANCRLMVIHNPTSDFLIADGAISNIDEIEKLDAFLDARNSMMVFMSPDVPKLTNLESYLEEWGIAFDRQADPNNSAVEYPHIVKDSSQALSTDGYTIVGEYFEYGMGGSLTKEMRSSGYPKKVIFSNAMSISYTFDTTHFTDEDDSSVSFDYGYNYSNNTSRSVFDLFVTSENAVAFAAGEEVAKATEINPLKLMTLSVETRSIQEEYTTLQDNSYVLACGSTDFTAASLLNSASYGNTDLLLSACRTMGSEPVPVGLNPKPFADYDIDTITTSEVTQYTVVLTVVPALVAAVAGAVVLIRRKNR